MNRLRRLVSPETLFGRTALALALAFLLFGLLSATLLHFMLVRPQTRQAADDLASFLVLAAQIWVELPPYTRPDYEREMQRQHQLRILRSEAAEPKPDASHPYLSHLEEALSAHVGQAVHIHQHPEHPGWLWADFPMGGRIMRLGFRQERLQNQLVVILPLLGAAGLLIALLLAIILVRRITHPLAVMADASHRIGQGDFSVRIPETGPREIAELASTLNLMEGRIQQLLENRTTLLAGISHDLRTPLTRMRLELELLGDQGDQALIAGLHENISEMEQLITQTLLLARGLGREDKSEIAMDRFLQGIAKEFRQSGHDVTGRPCPSVHVEAAANALRRVISNLVQNAVIYSEGEPVTLDCQSSLNGVEIHVVDRGPGIPPGERNKIFEPFHRLEGSRSRTTGGSGLGLAIVGQLCRVNGWAVTVGPGADGTGSTFTLRLPAT